MLSKTKINDRWKKKTNNELVEAIFLAKKMNLTQLASEIACPTKKQAKVNLGKLNEIKSETIIVPGKILSLGEVKGKFKIYALGASSKAKEKIKKAGCDFKTIIEALRKGEKIKGEIIR